MASGSASLSQAYHQILCCRPWQARSLLTFVRVPRELKVQSDSLLHVSASGHRLQAELFHSLDAQYGPHSIDSLATVDN